METTERGVREAALELLKKVLQGYKADGILDDTFRNLWREYLYELYGPLMSRENHPYRKFDSTWTDDIRTLKADLRANDPSALDFAEKWLTWCTAQRLKGES
jgi:hypothetical protein